MLQVNLQKIEKDKVTDVRIDSLLYPSHEFSIGHFESSYNPTGFNVVLDKIAGATLYTIFNHLKDETSSKPDWEDAKNKITQAIKHIQSFIEDYGGFYKATVVFEHNNDVDSEEKAIKVFRQELSKYKKNPLTDFGNYTSEQGEFLLANPWKVLAIIPGNRKVGKQTNKCVYVVHEENIDWYLKALYIIQETVSYVLAQKDIESYQLHWSN